MHFSRCYTTKREPHRDLVDKSVKLCYEHAPLATVNDREVVSAATYELFITILAFIHLFSPSHAILDHIGGAAKKAFFLAYQ